MEFKANCLENDMSRKEIKPRRSRQRSRQGVVEFNLAREAHYIQRRAAERDGRFVTIGELAFFSCETGDAWMLDPADRLATPLARDGNPEPLEFEETEATFTICWKGSYHIDGSAFVYIDQASGRVVTILGYPAAQIAQLG
jgi:hypothetical protein